MKTQQFYFFVIISFLSFLLIFFLPFVYYIFQSSSLINDTEVNCSVVMTALRIKPFSNFCLISLLLSGNQADQYSFCLVFFFKYTSCHYFFLRLSCFPGQQLLKAVNHSCNLGRAWEEHSYWNVSEGKNVFSGFKNCTVLLFHIMTISLTISIIAQCSLQSSLLHRKKFKNVFCEESIDSNSL